MIIENIIPIHHTYQYVCLYYNKIVMLTNIFTCWINTLQFELNGLIGVSNASFNNKHVLTSINIELGGLRSVIMFTNYCIHNPMHRLIGLGEHVLNQRASNNRRWLRLISASRDVADVFDASIIIDYNRSIIDVKVSISINNRLWNL